ncbi:unnamed protein product [Brachionus calyciflorus]|uniref:Adenosine deaminase domain-containing protein n=1 Tax=Brachionus calyciflorus TaxID=104777 RepID=A0A814KMR0_9BILA|nr:unnamed protein product [Brachionus calyciflorus]
MSKVASLEQLKTLPKIELHAHLSGSVRYSTILRLLNEELASDYHETSDEKLKSEIQLMEELKSKPTTNCTSHRSLTECFQIFTILHRLLSNLNILEQVTNEILHDFQSDNCVYLELRTTPRNIFDSKTGELKVSKEQYLKTVVNVIESFEKENLMKVRLILSVDRAKGLQDGLENVELAKKFKSKHVIGIDFSGNPHVDSFQNYESLFQLCDSYELKTTVHIAEIWEDKDVDFILKKIRPDRIGHSVCLTKEQIDYLIRNPIPIEICPTSNLVTKCVDVIENHPFYEFYTKKDTYPLVICTDDFGIFDTSLSREYSLISTAFNLSFKEMFDLSRRSIKCIFDQSNELVSFLEMVFNEFEKKNFE